MSSIVGVVFISTGLVRGDISDLQITEVVPSAGQVEVTNIGAEMVTTSSSMPFCHRFRYSNTMPAGTMFMPGESKVFAVQFTNPSDSDLWLYRNSNFSSGEMIISGLKWGPMGNVGRSMIAFNAGKWSSANDFAPSPPAGMALKLIGEDPTDPSSWMVGEPDLGNFTMGNPPMPRMGELTFRITNLSPDSGTYFTPVWLGFHDGSFDIFNSGEKATVAIESLAEDGASGMLTDAIGIAGTQFKTRVVESGNAVPVYAPGQSNTISIMFDAMSPASRYMTYASMVLPSNDAFVANESPEMIPLFDNAGNIVFKDKIISGSMVLDAGTEVNDEVPANTPLLGQASPNTGATQNGVIGIHGGYKSPAEGGILSMEMFANADFKAEGYDLMKIELVRVPEIESIKVMPNPAGNGMDIMIDWIGGLPPYTIEWTNDITSDDWNSMPHQGTETMAMMPMMMDSDMAFFRIGGMPALTTASYKVEFDSVWDVTTHPNQFPNAPHYSGLIGATHNSKVSFWAPGEIASRGIESMAETGSKSALRSEVESAMEMGNVHSVLSGGGIGNSPGSVSMMFDVDPHFPLVSLVSMIAPSPDWFVGIHDLNLIQNGNWVDRLEISLHPYDAGTDSGISYASPNSDTNPKKPIARITGSPFLHNGEVAPLGTFILTRME